MTDIEQQLRELEEQFWTGDANFYGENLTSDCLMVFQAPIGMLARDTAIEAISAGPRWKTVAFDVERDCADGRSLAKAIELRLLFLQECAAIRCVPVTNGFVLTGVWRNFSSAGCRSNSCIA